MTYPRIALTLLIVSLAGPAFGVDKRPTLDIFFTEATGLLSRADSAALSSQADMGVNSATKIQPARPSDVLASYTTTMNSGVILVNFPLSESERKEVNDVVGDLLGKSQRVTIEPIASTQSVVYSAISIRKTSRGSAILEILVGVADWPSTKKHESEGVVQALLKSTIWFSASRKKLLWRDIAEGDNVSFVKAKEVVSSLYQNNINSLLLAF